MTSKGRVPLHGVPAPMAGLVLSSSIAERIQGAESLGGYEGLARRDAPAA